MDVTQALLESWNREARIVSAVASRITESNRKAKPSEDGWPLDAQLAHIHIVRKYWLSQVSPERAAALGESYEIPWEKPIDDLEKLKSLLDDSGAAVGRAVSELLDQGVESRGGYDHPVLFLQHMIWHEGWHVGLVFLALRLAGQEPPQEWEEANVWGEWRVEEF